MNILLDTHCWLWWISEPDRLSESAKSKIEDINNLIFLSAASSWEISIKYSLGNLPLPKSPEKFVPQRLLRDGISPLPVEHIHALRVASLPPHHKDPFDRLLIAQAQVERFELMTADEKMAPYEASIIWAR